MFHKRSRKLTAAVLAAALLASGSLPAAAFASENTTPAADVSAQGGPPAPPPGGFGGADTMTYDYSGTLSGALTADGETVTADSRTISASEVDQNAALAQNGGNLTITGGTLSKTGSDTNGDNCNFYGINAIALAVGENSVLKVADSGLTADSTGSNALFATDKGTIYANNDTIVTTAGNSRGLDATYGGTIVANRMAISTAGNHSASVATDRGGGSISLTNSTLATAGSGSPLLYSTGNIQVDNVKGTATGSQIAGMEGYNTILINDSDLESTITGRTASDPSANGIIIYQSTSGDAEASTGETATFQATDSTLSSAIESGAMFYLINTRANVLLKNTALNFDSSKANLLTVSGNDANNWGTPGANGADLTLTGIDQTLTGDIDVDTISTLNLYLLQGTTYTGAAAITENSVNTDASEAPINVSIDGSSVWKVTEDSAVSNLHCAEGARIVDENGRSVTIVADGRTVVQGDSDVTITVTGSYDNSVTTTDVNNVTAADIDRSDFDGYYGTETAYGENQGAARNTNITTPVATGGDEEQGGSQPPTVPGKSGKPQTISGGSFSDVASDYWAAEVIAQAAKAGLMSGTSTGVFSPETALTRAQAAAVLYRLEGSPEAQTTSFADVSADAWYAAAVAWAEKAQIVSGYGNGTFGPDDEITREQLAAILVKYAAYKGWATAADTSVLAAYDDGATVDSYARGAMAWAVAGGIVKGMDDGSLSPQSKVTRAQGAAMMVRFLTANNAMPSAAGKDSNGEPAKPEGDLKPDKPEE